MSPLRYDYIDEDMRYYAMMFTRDARCHFARGYISRQRIRDMRQRWLPALLRYVAMALR